MTRRVMVRLHRWAGIGMAAVLVVAGLTGSLLAFLGELEVELNPQYRVVEQSGRSLDPLELRDRMLQRIPGVHIDEVPLHRESDLAWHFWVELPDASRPGQTVTSALVLDPFTGEEISRRSTNIWPLSAKNAMAFVYRLHYSLALGDVGLWGFGLAALVWTLDCFVGAWLTLPMRGGQRSIGRLSWWMRWATAWRIKSGSSRWRRQFDVHRAIGLWTWAMLLVFAWSAVSFNLRDQVYLPVMRVVFDMADPGPSRTGQHTGETPAMPWREAHAVARRLMTKQAMDHGFQVIREQMLRLDRQRGVYSYSVLSGRDVSERWGGTTVHFDSTDGRLLGLELPTGQNAGRTLTSWIVAMHTASIWGLPMKLAVSALGLAVAWLSCSGVYLWMRKRRAQRQVAGAQPTHCQPKRRM